MIGLPGNLTATVTPAPPRGSFGDPSGAAAASWTVEGCLFAPGETSERHDRGDTVVTTGTVYAPPGAVFPATATVEVGDFVGEVDGDPEPWASTAAGPAGVTVRLRRVKG